MEWTIDRINTLAKKSMQDDTKPKDKMREQGIDPDMLHSLSLGSFLALLDMTNSISDAVVALGSSMFHIGMMVQQEIDRNATEN